MQRFPTVVTALSARRRDRFVKAVEILEAGVADGVIANVIFKDDFASFRMKNSVVFVINSHGTRFNRFPLTFHNAAKGDGTKIKGVSEKKMNSEFVS